MAKAIKPKVFYDERADALYIAVRGGKEEEFAEVAPGVNVELNKEGEIIGVEILNLSQVLREVAKPLYSKVKALAVS